MKKFLSVIGFNIFAAGGTTQSNLNLMEEFINNGYEVEFFNFRDFNKMDELNLKFKNEFLKNVKIRKFKEIEDDVKGDLIFVTRESFFVLSSFLRKKYIDKVIIGEVHAPLSLVDENDIVDYLQYFDYIRVSTDSIKKVFAEKFNFKRTFVQTVSLSHIKIDSSRMVYSHKQDKKKDVNLLVRARFDGVKDIPYSIRLMDYLVNYLKQNNVYFYINGYGPGVTLFKNLINSYGLNENVFINAPTPLNYIYLSNSRVETFGYSMAEEISKGNAIIMYPGDDNVIFENFKDFKNIAWITKDVEKDAKIIMDFVQKPNIQKDFRDNIELLNSMKSNYFAKLLKSTSNFAHQSVIIPKKMVDFDSLLNSMEISTMADGLTKYRKIYYRLRKVPLIGKIVQNSSLKQKSMNLLSKVTSKLSSGEFNANKVGRNKVFIESFFGSNFSGDPKYLALALANKYPELEFYVSSVNQIVDTVVRDYGFNPVRFGSKKYVQTFKQCKYVIVNGNTLDKVGKQPGQIFIETWHGFPMKKMVNDLENPLQRKKESEAFFPRMLKWDYLLTSSKYNTKLLDSAFRLKKNSRLHILEKGTPKNEYLLMNKDNLEEKKRLYLKYFNRPYDSNKKIILFCPTWRKDKRKNVSSVDLREVIHSLPDNYELVVKLHPLESSLRRYYKSLDPRIFCFFNELVDIQELYILADVLISDYSSAIFDYSLLGKKIIILQEDGQQYKNSIGWYFDIEKECLIKGSNYSSSQLVKKILSNESTSFVYDEMIHQKLLSNEDENVSDYIINKVMKGRKN